MSEPISSFDPCETLTVREAAGLLHVSRPTVEKYIKAGELPSALIGRCRRIRRTDLEAFLEHRTAYGWQRYRPAPTPTVDRPMECSDRHSFLTGMGYFLCKTRTYACTPGKPISYCVNGL